MKRTNSIVFKPLKTHIVPVGGRVFLSEEIMKKQEKAIKYMDIKEFREKGYLQEVNRQFLHPLGLALEVRQDIDGSERLGKIWDYRKDKEGIYYNLKNSTQERINKFKEKAKFINDEFSRIGEGRSRKLGFKIEPIPEKN